MGISCGGALTLEVTKLLEAEGQRVRVLLVDGAPEITQAAAQQLNKDGDFDTNFVSSLLQTNVNTKITNLLIVKFISSYFCEMYLHS